MIKLILFLIILYIIYTLFFKKSSLKMDRKKKKDIKESSETMVECQKCGLFISSKDAIIKNGKYYCSKECAEL